MKRRPGSSVLCVGLTPALQETRRFDELRPGHVLRAESVTRSAAGKGANVARIAAQLGAPARLLGFFGGASGAFCLRALRGAHVRCHPIRVPGQTRVCITVLERRRARITELVEEASLPPPPAWTALYREFQAMLRGAGVVAISGALMPGAAADVYARLARAAARAGKPVLIDSQREPLLRALAERPLVAKLNVHELENTLERRLAGRAAITAACRELIRRGAQCVLVTDGARPAWWATPDAVRRVQPPTVRALNPIGSGDAAMAGLADALLRCRSLEDAVSFGLACGAANALTPVSGTVSPSAARRLRGGVRWLDPAGPAARAGQET